MYLSSRPVPPPPLPRNTRELLQRTRNRYLGQLAVGVFFVVGLAGGHRRHRHGPFAFADYDAIDTFLAVIGLLIIGLSLWQLVPVLRQLGRLGVTDNPQAMARAGLPRDFYELLLGVAARDGYVGADERAEVARLLTTRLCERVLAQDLKNWSITVEPARDPVLVARRIAPLMTADERRQLLQWCRTVAAGDGSIDADERDVLQQLAAVLHVA